MSTHCFKPLTGQVGNIIDYVMDAPEVKPYHELAYALRLVTEEIVVNINNYAYTDKEKGYLIVSIEKKEDNLIMEFRDGGVPFDPLVKEDPDITLPLEEREIGGLGIFLTKKLMDSLSYNRVSGENVLILVKHITNKKKN
ncbi:MAG: ATP-binding protein [Bacteroidaceae bacterium]|nr:ATP-binding protein [Bacteroidaceae bacterium]